MPQFEKGKRYCEECLDELEKEDIEDGYSVCCEERVVGFMEAQQINTQWHADDNF
jgi:hypothetical protein